uniref:SRCR domain-containing protein n=1 Tax=Astyanax mexicanus TaxID=7994 RepID=A0A3B1JCV3_ASTMX
SALLFEENCLLLYCSSFVIDGMNIRLVNGNSFCSGRVEVYYNGKWGTVCDDDWDINDAAVVCRQIGCGRALSAHDGWRFGQGSDPIHLDNVGCFGFESSITDCHHNGFGMHNCGHGEDAGVTCTGMLVNVEGRGNGVCSGRVEVYYNGEWGTVCDDDWDSNDAAVVCRQMGCGRAVSVHSSAHFGAGSGPIHLDNVGCSGSEKSITDCNHNGFGTHDCGHSQDFYSAAVPTSLILSYRLEIYYNGQWGTVCDDGWGMDDAEVVCSQMACGKATSTHDNAQFGQGSGPILLDDVGCSGTETTLTSCSHRGLGINDCKHEEDAAVVCSEQVA